jgi:hypothetical protein
MKRFTSGIQDPQMAKRVFSGYKRSLLIPTPVALEETMRQNLEEFNRSLGFRTEVRNGTLDILYRVWESARKAICEGAE